MITHAQAYAHTPCLLLIPLLSRWLGEVANGFGATCVQYVGGVPGNGARLVRYCGRVHSVGMYIQWACALSGCVHSVGVCTQWACTFSGCVHSVGVYIQWACALSGRVHSVGVFIQWACALSGRVHTELVMDLYWNMTVVLGTN